MDIVNSIVGRLGVDWQTAAAWLLAGFVLGLVMVGKRPLALFGDIVLGLVGAVGSGWAFARFGGDTADLGKYFNQFLPSLTETNAGYLGAFFEGFIGALVLLILVRLLIRS